MGILTCPTYVGIWDNFTGAKLWQNWCIQNENGCASLSDKSTILRSRYFTQDPFFSLQLPLQWAQLTRAPIWLIKYSLDLPKWKNLLKNPKLFMNLSNVREAIFFHVSSLCVSWKPSVAHGYRNLDLGSRRKEENQRRTWEGEGRRKCKTHISLTLLLNICGCPN